MGCVQIWERVVSKIRETILEEEILHLYCRQLSFKSFAMKLHRDSSTTLSQ
jgi:hypothetical protein